MRLARLATIVFVTGSWLPGQTPAEPSKEPAKIADEGGKKPDESKPREYLVAAGTKVPLSLINSVSTKHSAPGERIYLETAFPIVVNGRMVIPAGSYVAGTITQVKKPGRVKGRGEMYLRFDSLILANGVTRDFRARVSSFDGRASEEFDKTEGKIRSEGNKSGDARTVAETAVGGVWGGSIAGAIAGNAAKGAAIGSAAGAAAGIMAVLLSRGPDAVLARGTTLEMVLDRQLTFDESELDTAPGQRRVVDSASGPLPSQKGQQGNRRVLGLPGRF